MLHGTDLGDEVFRFIAQCLSEGNVPAAAGLQRIDRPSFNGNAEHLFEAKGLGAELNVVVTSFAAGSVFVFDRNDPSVGMKLHNVAAPLQAEPVRPERQGTFYPHSVFERGMGFVGAFVGMASAQREHIFVKDALDVDEGALPGAVGKVF